MRNNEIQDKVPYKNEHIKREFFSYLRNAKGFTDASVTDYAEALHQWQAYRDNEDFAAFDGEKAARFRAYLSERPARSKSGKLSITTIYHYVRRVKEFFEWLSEKPGYKGKVLKDDAACLRLPSNEMQIALAGTTKQTPTLDVMMKVLESIDSTNEVGKRDRAFISLLMTVGCRISAAASLKMKSFDKDGGRIYQNPRDGVKTKNSKQIISTFFPIGSDEPKHLFIEWHEYLQQIGFCSDDPIFPATAVELTSAKSPGDTSVNNRYSISASSARKMIQERCKSAGVKYYIPHSFRHFVVESTLKLPLTGEQMRAISLTLGHSKVSTTFDTYGCGSMTPDRAVETVKSLKDLPKGNGIHCFDDADLEAIAVRVAEKVLERRGTP